MEAVTNIGVFLSKCGLQSTEGISCFWAPHFCGSLGSDHVFVTDLAGIRVLSPCLKHSDISRSVSCVSKETKVSKSWFSVLEQCVPCICLCVHPPLLSAERGRCAHREGVWQATPVPWILNVRGTSSNQAPGVTLTYNQNQSINLRGSLYVKQGWIKACISGCLPKIAQKFLVETITI